MVQLRARIQIPVRRGVDADIGMRAISKLLLMTPANAPVAAGDMVQLHGPMSPPAKAVALIQREMPPRASDIPIIPIARLPAEPKGAVGGIRHAIVERKVHRDPAHAVEADQVVRIGAVWVEREHVERERDEVRPSHAQPEPGELHLIAGEEGDLPCGDHGLICFRIPEIEDPLRRRPLRREEIERVAADHLAPDRAVLLHSQQAALHLGHLQHQPVRGHLLPGAPQKDMILRHHAKRGHV